MKLVSTFVLSTILSLTLFSAKVFADRDVNVDMIELSFNSGYASLDNSLILEADEGSDFTIDSGYNGGWGLGLQLNQQWRTILNYSRQYDYWERHKDGLRVQQYHIDVARDFNTDSKLRPFLVLSLGQLNLKASSRENDKYFQMGTGAGLTYRFNANWSVRTEYRVFHNFDDFESTKQFQLAVAYRFGNGDRFSN